MREVCPPIPGFAGQLGKTVRQEIVRKMQSSLLRSEGDFTVINPTVRLLSKLKMTEL